MATIDDKVVSMSFESSKFEQGVDKTIASLKKLQDALRFPEAGKGLQAVSASAKEVDLGHIHKGIDGISSKLGALRLTAIAVFSQLATKAVAAGAQMIKALTLGPAIQGFKEYETQINAVQTILANTAAAGTNIRDVNKALDELNEYADMTIYNFSEMTRNIGTFTAAGVDLKTAVGSIKGIANLAAVSGSNAQQASTAMYQLSQAISSGTVKLMDWNSVVNAGMGGTVFQRALAQTAVHMGTLKKGAVELAGPMKNVRVNGESFRNSLSAAPGKEGWLSSKVLTATLKQLSGDMTDAQLKAQGYTDAQIKAIQAQAKMAVEAATRVKTLTQLISTTKEQLGSGWAQTWRIVFGDFLEAREMFTDVSNTFGELIGASADARNKMLKDWKALGGRTQLINAISAAFHNLAAIIKPIKDAFRDIFPRTTGKQLYELTLRFKEFAESLKPSPQTVENLRRTFRGLFALLDIGKQIIFGILGVFGKLLGAVGDGSGGFLEITANIGDFLVKVDQALKKGGRLAKFFDTLGTIIAAPVKALGMIVDLIGGLFSGGFSDNVNQATKSMSPFQKAVEGVSKVLDKFLDLLGEVGEVIRPLIESYVEVLSQIGPLITQALSNMNFEAILAVVRTGLLAGLFLMFKKFLGGGPFVQQLTKGFAGIGGGILKNISGSFAALQGSLTALQQNLKAKTLKEIAIAVALLAVSMVALSFVDPKRLNSALTAITIAFGQLLGAMAILGNISKSMGFIKMPVIAATLIGLAAAITILSVAVLLLSTRSWEELAKGLGGVAVLLAGIVAVTGPLSKASPRMIAAGVGITAIAIALNLLALAVRQMGSMNLQQLGKGLGSIAVGLGILIAAMTKMPTRGLILAGAGLIAMAVGLNLLALAVRNFGSMDVRTIAQGMAGVAVSMAIIAGAMRLMPGGKGMIVTAAALVLVALALNGIALAVKTMAGMGIKQMAIGLIGLAVALGILAVAMKVMETSIVGAIALGIIAASVYTLASALAVLGALSWKQIIKGLVALAAAFVIIGAAGYLITGAVPGLLGFGAAMLLIGAGLALAGAGLFAIGAGLSALVVAAPTGFGVLLQAVVQFQKGLIENVKLFVLGILEIVKALADTAPQFVDALVKILKSLITAITKVIPMLVPAINALVTTIIRVLDMNQDKIIQAGIDLILALLNGIRKNIRAVVNAAVGIITNFLRGIASNITKIIAAGGSILLALLKGIARYYTQVATTVITIIAKFLGAIATNLPKIATAGLSILTKLLGAIAKSIGRVITAGANVIVKFIQGIGQAGPRVITAGTNTIIKLINALQKNANKLADAGAKAIIAFVNGLATTIEARAPQMRAAGMKLGIAIADGMSFGLVSKARELASKATSVAGGVLGAIKKKVKSKSPSQETYDIGQNIVLGLANGLSDSTKAVTAAEDMGNSVIDMFNTTFQTQSPSKVTYQIGQFVGQGFADGLRGSQVAINEETQRIFDTFEDLNNRINNAMQSTTQSLATDQARRAELLKGKETAKETAQINKLNKEIKNQKTVLNELRAARSESIYGLRAERAELIKNAQEFKRLSDRLDEAKSNLEDLTRIRDDAIAGYAEQFGKLPDVIMEDKEGNLLSGADQLANYMQGLTTQIGAVQTFNSTLEQLRNLGLDDTTYRMLLDTGPSAQSFADALLKGGPALISSMNSLDSQLKGAATTLGTNAASHLYDAGVKAAQGVVKGLESQMSTLEKTMGKLVDKMVAAIKKKLKIKSPSEVFAEIGQQSMEGLATGFTDSTKLVTDAVDQAAQDALTQMEQSMRDISDVVSEQLNPNPVITPILDLTQVQSKAAELAALTGAVPITAAASYGQASAISAAQLAAQAQADQNVALGGSVNFEQNNYSPKALTDIEIYRQTKNQLSLLKSSLALT